MPLPVYHVKSSGYGQAQSDTNAGGGAPKVKGMQIMRNDTVEFTKQGRCAAPAQTTNVGRQDERGK